MKQRQLVNLYIDRLNYEKEQGQHTNLYIYFAFLQRLYPGPGHLVYRVILPEWADQGNNTAIRGPFHLHT